MPASIVIQRESPDQPEVRAMLAQLDGYLAGLYPPEANHILELPGLLVPAVSFFVARSGQHAVGTAAVRRMPAEAATGSLPYGEVKRMFVHPQARGLGLGARLLATLEDEMRRQALPLSLLETGDLQREAVRLYERAGYKPRAAFGGYPDNGLSLFMGKTL